jgi:gliding motility-associated-like protein
VIKTQFLFGVLIALGVILESNAQLGFCNGNSGATIFNEDFGTGTTNNALPGGTTTYNYINDFPDDGFYTVTHSTTGNIFDWHQINDHTEGDTNGKFLIINAGFSVEEFYRITITGLCENTTYEFSSWLSNLTIANSYCATQPGGTIPVNVRFEIWDNTNTNLLAFGSTGNITETSTPIWQEFALVFQTLPTQTSVILKMINNGSGGCGNDVAIDDIEFKTCGDFISVEDENANNNVAICSGATPYDTTLTAIPDGTVFSSYFYQWQMSTDNVNWTDILGENNVSITLTGITTTLYYRVKLAEYMSNLNVSNCNTFSNVFSVTITQPGNPPNIACWETATLNNNSCTWDITGMQPEAPTDLECWQTATFNNTTCVWEVIGTQPEAPVDLECWETTIFNDALCEWEIVGTETIEYIDEMVNLCEDQAIVLNAGIEGLINPQYLWSNGATTEGITVNTADVYTVEVTHEDCFTIIKTITVHQSEAPIIQSVVSDGSNIVVTMSGVGHFEYSLNGFEYQEDSVFYNVQGGMYLIYVRDIACGVFTIQHLHFFIPKFFTPNGDTINDTFNLYGIEHFGDFEVCIFDRFGKLLKVANNTSVIWDGRFNGQLMPTSDYWYIIKIANRYIKGHITLKR